MKDLVPMHRCGGNLIVGLAFCLPLFSLAVAEEVYTITLQDHVFSPAQLSVPAGKKIKLLIENKDSSPEEFESHDLNREKIVPARQHIIVYAGPLKKGSYPYFGDFHKDKAQGVIVAE